LPVYFAAPAFARQGVVAGFVLSAPDYSGTPAGSGASVSFSYYAADITVGGKTLTIATGYEHSVTIGGDVYAYVQRDGDTPAAVATALADLVNGAAEALATATAPGGGLLILAPRQNTGAAIACSASDGAVGQTLFELTGNELVPAITRGVLFAQGTMYRPATAPVLPAAPASRQSWLLYSSTTGWYWAATPTPWGGDALLGWVVTSATAVIAISSSKIGTGEEAITSGGPMVSLPGIDAGLPPAPTFDATATDSQLTLGNLTFASAENTEGVNFVTFILYYVDQSVASGLTLTANMAAAATAMSASGALPASAPGSVTFTFLASGSVGPITIGPGYRHSIGIGAETYVYEQQVEDTAADIAVGLADAIDAAGDPNALATAVGATVVLTALQNTAASVTCSASDGNTPATLTETMASLVVIDKEILGVQAADGSVVARAQKGSTKPPVHLAGATIWPVAAMTVVFALPMFTYGTPAWPTVIGQIPWDALALVAADCWVANEIGPSPITTECFLPTRPRAIPPRMRGGASPLMEEMHLSAPATLTPTAAGQDQALLVVFLEQDGTGHAVTWEAGYKWAPPIPTDPNTCSLVTFAGRSSDGCWYCIGSVLGRKI
jgi:hypothetical protein